MEILSNRILNMAESETLAMTAKAREYKQSGAKEQVEKIMQHLKSYTMENEQNDDITLMSVKL